MGDHSSFTSLMAMVESHLSKTSVGEQRSDQGSNAAAAPSFSLPNICSVRNTDSEQFLLPPPSTIMQLPRFEVKNSEITEILAHQVKNMLVAKENAQIEENEKQKLSDRLKGMKLKNEDDDYVIDLSASIIRPDVSVKHPIQEVEPELSAASSMESLHFVENTELPKELPKVKEQLPICNDMSYILFKRVKRGKCSVFGRVLGARLRTAAAPYLHVRVLNPDVVPFDFSTPSPCDINRQRRLHPPQDNYSHMNMVDRFMAITKDEV